jgi:hypothetical protein
VVSKAKLYSKLDALEAELEARLVPHLRGAAQGKNDLVFCAKMFTASRAFKNTTDELTEELIVIGSQILSLRDKLQEPVIGTIAERICWYCREWAAKGNRRNASGAELARKFLAEIEDGKIKEN